MSVQHDPPLVLIVDDQEATTRMLERLFVKSGYQAKSVHNGYDALEAAQKLLPDLILLDVMMPGIDGLEVLSRLRESPVTAGLPTILITAKNEPSDIAHGLQLGADDYIPKPFHPNELLARAESKIQARKLEMTLQRRTQELEALLRVSEELNQHLEVDELLELLLYLVLDLLPGEMSIILQIEDDHQIVTHSVRMKEGATDLGPINSQRILEHFTQGVEAVMWPGDATLVENYSAGMAVALQHWNDMIGVLMLVANQPYDHNHLRLFKGIGRQATLALRNAELYKIQANYAMHLEDMVAERTKELEAAQQLLIRSEKLASVGRLAASIAHEINNPLMPIQINLEHMLEDIEDGVPVSPSDIQETLSSVERIRKIVNQLLSFTRKPTMSKGEATLLDISEVIENIIGLNRKFFEKSGVQVVVDIPSLPRVYGSRYQLEQVFMNLALNAAAAMPDGGTLTFKAWQEEDEIVIETTDTGIGIPPDMIDRIFEPFISSKEDGTGLGLFISYGIIQNHQGSITVNSAVGKGTTFTIRLPISE